MLAYFIRRVHGRRGFVKPRVVIAIPSGITAVEKRAVLDSAERAGARRVYLVEEPMAAGIGAGLPITEPQASMIVDIGGGTTEVAIMSLADIAVSESIRTAGDDFDEAICVNHMKKTYNPRESANNSAEKNQNRNRLRRPLRRRKNHGSPRPRHDLGPPPQMHRHLRRNPGIA